MSKTAEKKPEAADTRHDDRALSRRDGKNGKKPQSWWRILGVVFVLVVLALVGVRAVLPIFVRNYVNDALEQAQMYSGRIGDVDLHLWRGAYSIHDVRINKIIGNVPAPLFEAPRVDLAIQWDALRHGQLVGRILFEQPELNFADGEDDADVQTGGGEPWLQIIQDLFPFRINSAVVRDGSIHFRAHHTDPPVNVYLSEVEAVVENLTNIRDEITPLFSTVSARAKAMDHAEFEYEMTMDPFSYRPTFQLAVRLVNLDVKELNDLAMAYGAFDFEDGWFDLTIELNARAGRLEGYVQPLFRDLQIFSLEAAIQEGDVINAFWQALVGLTAQVFRNWPRDQFGTRIPIDGDVTDPQTSLLEIIGNTLRNAFVRAYLPRLEGVTPDVDWMRFSPGHITDPASPAPL